ncbi:MAG: tetratricopeptide repeat protein [Desulfobacteria bacterium]
MTRLSLTLILVLIWAGGAWAHMETDDLPDSVAIMQYRLLLYMNPDDTGPRNSLAMALYRTNELDEAEKELRHILERDPSNFDALDGLGMVLIRMEKHQEAMQYLDKAVKINELDVMVHVHLSVLYEKMMLPEKAGMELNKARSLASDPVQLEKIDEELKLVSD